MLNETEKYIPTSFEWEIDIENKKVTNFQKTLFRLRTQEVFGDCANPLSSDYDYFGIQYVDFDDFEMFKMLNNIMNDKNTVITITKLNTRREHVFKIVYSNCKIVNVKNNLKYNGSKEPLDNNVVYFKFKKRQVITL